MNKKEIKEKLNKVLEDSYIYNSINEIDEVRFMEVLEKELPELYADLYSSAFQEAEEIIENMRGYDYE